MDAEVAREEASAPRPLTASRESAHLAAATYPLPCQDSVFTRRPGFSKSQLAAGLDARGIAYVHLRGLGTPKEGRLAARSGQYETLQKIYAKHLKTAQAKEELDELSALVTKSGPICILCYERDHRHCHRRWIAEIIEERDDGTVENLAARQS